MEDRGVNKVVEDAKNDMEHHWDSIDEDILLSAVSEDCCKPPGEMEQRGKRSIELLDTSAKCPSPKKQVCVQQSSPMKPASTESAHKVISGAASAETTPLERFTRGYLSVTDLVAQNWCEQQMVFQRTLPKDEHEEDKPEMLIGSSIHLVRELEVQDTVLVDTTSKEDSYALKLLNMLDAVNSFLRGAPVKREVYIFGAPFGLGVTITGIIDDIRCDLEDFTFDIFELKTRRSNTLPKPAQYRSHQLQVMLYKKLFDDMVMGLTSKKAFADALKLKLHNDLGTKVIRELKNAGLWIRTLDPLIDAVLERMKSLPKISQLFIEYCFQDDATTLAIKDVQYDEDYLRTTLQQYVAYWKGERACRGVEIEEADKCQVCKFKDICEWREEKALAYSSGRAKVQVGVTEDCAHFETSLGDAEVPSFVAAAVSATANESAGDAQVASTSAAPY